MLNENADNNLTGCCLLLCLSMLACDSAGAREKTWYKYENSHFEAYSDESQRIAKKRLIQLENFRAAVLQVANISVPEGAPKVQVYIFSSRRAFEKLVERDDIGGFAFSENGIPYMVLASGAYAKVTEATLRHEYAHVLLGYKNIRFPKWFNEGFAELMSATTFRKKDTEFSVGSATVRRRALSTFIPWSTIISSDFSPHKFESAGRASDAYLQSWFLTHYFMLGNNFENTRLLTRYLSLLAAGHESVDAFEMVVGMPVDQFGDRLLDEYSMKYVTYKLRNTTLDHEFKRDEVAAELMLPLLDRFRGRFE